MTLWEAIRQMKEGQEIVYVPETPDRQVFAIWAYGEQRPEFPANFYHEVLWTIDVTIHDLPRPQTLYDVLVEGAKEKVLEIQLEEGCEDCIAWKNSGDSEKPLECNCSVALIDTLQSIALASGFDLKKVVK